MRRSAAPLGGLVAALSLGGATLGAQSVTLQLQPHVGDTIRVHMEQQSELTGTRHGASGDARSSMNSMMQVYSRVIVEGLSSRGATVSTIADSAILSSTDPRTGKARGQPQHLPTPPRVRFVVTPAGTMEMLDATGQPNESEIASLMPAALPKGAITVGSTWKRDMPIPGSIGGAQTGMLHATFRLDSLSHEGRFAYMSMRGALAADSVRTSGRPTLESGSVTGLMVLDRVRGWMAESHFTILATAGAETQGAGGMHFQMKVTQRMRADTSKR